MRPRGFMADWQPRRKSRELLEQIDAILATYEMALTIRQIFYRLVARYSYEKTERAYKNLAELLNKARRARRIPMEAIRDDGFVSHEPFFYRGIDHFLASLRRDVETLRLDRQQGQRRRLVVMCEAGGMAGQLYDVTEPFGIPVLSAGGFDSTTDKHRLGEIWGEAAQQTTVLRIGDYDPSGETMSAVLLEDVGAFVEHYGGDLELVQVAITPEQARSRNLPSAPPKETDNRGRYFTDTETWQAEALDPRELAGVLGQAIEERFDRDAYATVLREEDEIRGSLMSRFGDGL